MKQTGIATLALLLALNVALGTILGAGMKAYAAADTYGLRVGGTEITSEQLTVKSESGTATYDPKTHTLTLNNYKYNGDGYYGSGEGGGIDYRGDADLLIILQGSNSITKSATSNPDRSHGIYFNVVGHTLTISGDGSLEISFAKTTSGIEKRNGIFCEPGAFVMESGTVTTSGGTANESAGIYTQDGITINGGTFTGIGNPTTKYESRGIYTQSGITINGGKVTAQATNNTNDARAFEGFVTINGGTVTASASSTNGEAKAFSASCKISVASELLDMKVGDSKENATATTNPDDVSEKKYVYIKVNEKEDINPTVSITGWIYGEYSETANAPSVTGNTGNGTVTYSYKVKDAEDSTYTSTVPTDAGDYTVQASIAAAGKYKAGSATADFTVSKADPTIKAPTTQELSYTGTAQALVTAGTTTGGTMVYALGTSTAATNDYSASIPTATDEGTYYVWYKVLGDTNYKDSAPAVVSVTMTLTRYTINYEMNGGSNSENNPSSYTMKSKDITLSSPAARNGYTFIGWTGSNGTTPSTSVTIPSGSSGNKSYTANWQKITYKISFDLNSGELGEGQTNPTNYDVESEKFSPNAPTKKGYDFEGWLLSGDATGTLSKDLKIPTGTTGNREYIAQWKLNVYTLSYTLDGGTASPDNPTSYTVNSDDFTLTNPTKKGYTFAGWTGTDVDVNTSKDVKISQGSTGNRAYTANWKLNVYTLSYTLDGGIASPDNPTSYTVNSDDFTLTNPTKKGYTFAGWTGTDVDVNTSKDVKISQGSIGNREYVANLRANIYAVKFATNGGSGSMSDQSFTYDQEQALSNNTFTRNGYTFKSWKDNTSNTTYTNGQLVKNLTDTDNGIITLYAQWTATANIYKISFDLNGGKLGESQTNPTIYDIDSEFSPNTPTRKGYDFEGWLLSGDTTGTVSKDLTIPTGTTGDREYIAQWSLHVYALSYDLQGGIASPDNPTSYTIESADIKLTRPTKQGYDFTGWSFDAEISLDVTLPKGSTGDRNYVATWGIITYTISYDLQGGNVSGTNPTSYNCEANTFKLTTPTRTGYTFAGWTGAGVTGTSTDITIPTGSTGNRSYTATWTAVEYAISYTLNNGSVSGNPDKYTIESKAITLNNPTKNGYTFTGWTGTDLNGKTQTVTISKGSTENRSYTANFTPITYTISYELNGGTNNAENPTSYTIESATVTLKAPTRDGYNFGGWTFNGEAISEIAQGSTGNKTLTATWVETHGEMKPVISPASYALTVYKGQSSSLTLNATGTNLKWDMSGSLPIGMTFSNAGNSATISGTPELGTSGSYVVTVTATNAGGSASSEITITVVSDFAISGDVEVGTLTTIIPESARSQTTTQTVFRNGTGQKILTADIAITTESDDFEAVAVNPFTTTVKVDVTLNLSDTNYDGYEYSMSITGLPEWLSIEGDLESTDILKVGESTHSHEFILTGTPTTSSDAETFNLTATVKVSGDIPTLEASGSKEVKISVATPEPESISEVLQSLSVKISGNETLTTNAGTSASIAFTADVNGSYSNGLTKTLSSGSYVLTWNASNAEGLSFSDGTLIVKESASVGMHELQITATAVSNDVTGTDSKTVIVTVREVAPGTVSETPNTVQVSAEQISNMTDDEIAETFAKNTNVVLTGNVANLSETIARLETLTDIKTLDLSQITGVSELKLENTKLESITLEGNQSITKVEITGNETLTTLNLSGSKVETVDAEGCKNLVSINVEGAENLTALNVTETKITTLNVKDCAKLEMVNAKGCSNLEEVNLNGCESLEYLDVSETAITELNITGCVKLGTLYCASCDIKGLNFEGCDNLETLDCSNNSLVFLDASRLNHLRYLECRHQQVSKPLTGLMNFADLLLGLGSLGTSAADESKDVDITSYSANVKNLKAYNEAGNEITSEYDTATGEIKFSATPSRITYDYDTGFEEVMMDVEVIASEDNSYVGVGSPGSGCASGLGIGALAVLMFLLVLTSKTKITK